MKLTIRLELKYIGSIFCSLGEIKEKRVVLQGCHPPCLHRNTIVSRVFGACYQVKEGEEVACLLTS